MNIFIFVEKNQDIIEDSHILHTQLPLQLTLHISVAHMSQLMIQYWQITIKWSNSLSGFP